MNSISARYLAFSSLLVFRDISVATAVQARMLTGLLDNSVSAYEILPVRWYEAFLIENCVYHTALSCASVSNDTNNGRSFNYPFCKASARD